MSFRRNFCRVKYRGSELKRFFQNDILPPVTSYAHAYSSFNFLYDYLPNLIAVGTDPSAKRYNISPALRTRR